MIEKHDRIELVGLRNRAEEKLCKQTGSVHEEATRDAQLIHDLRVHQIELEMQNEELRRMQLQLESSQSRYFALYDLAPIGYVTMSEKGLVLEANLSVADLLGVARSALINQAFTRFILAQDQDVFYRHFRQLLDKRMRQVCELRVVRKDATALWVRLEATPFREADGVFVCHMVVSDVGERKRTEEILSASEARHRILFEKAHDALMTIAPPTWQFTASNSAAVRMFGARNEADFVSRTLWQYSPERQPDGRTSAEKLRAIFEIGIREGSHFFEWTHQRLSGERFPATILLTRIEIDGKPLLHASVRDETEGKELRAMLAQADRLASMGLLAASVAHEINNPLTYVIYNVDRLVEDLPKLASAVQRCTVSAEARHTPLTESIAEDATMLRPAALRSLVERAREALSGMQRIKQISKALGTFSKVEDVERHRTNLTYSIECAVNIALNEIRHRAKLRQDFGEVPDVWASEGQLSQVFLNLLINAAHAIDEGDVENNCITVRTWANGDDVFTEVEDTGHGISKENLERIFEPFFTTKPVGVGSGLGLSICKNILSEFDGDLSVQSEVGKGSRFLVRLRACAPEPELTRGQQGPVKSDAPARGRILVIDDEGPIRAILTQALGEMHDVVSASSGGYARTILEQDNAFDVIFCDLMMPDMTGMDLYEWIVQHSPRLTRRMVFITGGAFTPKAAEFLSQVDNLTLQKPFDIGHLLGVAADLINQRRAHYDRLS